MNELSIPETFNVATAYVDANIAAGRGAQTAFLYRDQQITYQDVLEHVNRTGNALRGLGLDIEHRVALLLLDSQLCVGQGALQFIRLKNRRSSCHS